MELDRRALTADDAPELTALLATAEAQDRTGKHLSAEDVAEELSGGLVDLARCSLGLFDGPRLLGYATVESRAAEPAPRQVYIDGVVHPGHRRRGLGRLLLDWSIERAGAHWAADRPLVLRAYLIDGNPGKAELLRRSGFTEARLFCEMVCPLPRPSTVAVPDGLRLVPYERRYDEEMRQARNTAFAEHWGSVPRDERQWRALYTGTRVFRPQCTFLLLDEAGRIAAYLIGHQHGDGTDLWIPNIGTLPRWRGRGAASALLAHTLNAAADQGYTEVGLSVDTDNTTGALGVYRRAGFTVARSSRRLALDLP